MTLQLDLDMEKPAGKMGRMRGADGRFLALTRFFAGQQKLSK
jgi:hypothetical protein